MLSAAWLIHQLAGPMFAQALILSWFHCNTPYALRQRSFPRSVIAASLQANAVVFPLANATSIGRKKLTTCYAVCCFHRAIIRSLKHCSPH